jgi:hypothetical protein
MMKPERTSSLVWLGFAVLICIESLRLPRGSLREPGPGFLPLLVGVILAGLSTISLVQAQAGSSADGKSPWAASKRWKKLLWVLFSLLAYALALETLGFLLATCLLLVFLFRFGMEPQRWSWAIAGSAIASLFCYAVFELWLRTQLPGGILGF